MTGIHPNNQAPELANVNVYTSDPALRRAVQRGGAGWHDAELIRQGAEYGAESTLRLAEDADKYSPELHTHSAAGDRIDVVKFHPAWHEIMQIARHNGLTNLPYTDTRPSAWVAYGASVYMHIQIEAGSSCPTTMTKASIPVLQRNQALFDSIWPKLADTAHDPRDIPLEGKRSMTVGMGMTEKQGGSDLRTNETLATPTGHGPWGEEFRINGHKWFFSAPMCDAHLVLARTEERGPSCFYVPRWRPDGSKNPIHVQRLKDKVGNRSNSSSEVEFHDAWGVLVGEEGRGIPTIIEMATYTRLDIALGSAGLIRRAFAQALHHARNRHAFGKALADQPLMREVLGDMALESEAAMLLALDLASRFGSASPLDLAWQRLLTPVAKFWNTKRSIAIAAEAMEVFGGNGYVETGPMGRLYREAPVNSIWEGSGNVMCLDLLRAVSRSPEDVNLVLGHLLDVAADEPLLRTQVEQLRAKLLQPTADVERDARRLTQKLALCVQAGLMLQYASPTAAAAFISSRFDPDWGTVFGISAGTTDVATLLRDAWEASPEAVQ
ncbi:MAG: acyl-CoA dehydrogenase family protein [Pigmentiphaga sp.]